jgi:hypothetical protein
VRSLRTSAGPQRAGRRRPHLFDEIITEIRIIVDRAIIGALT